MRRRFLACFLFFLALLPQAAVAASSLADSGWVLVEEGKRPPSIHFAADGKVTGFSGCNRFFGQYQQFGEKLSLSAMSATRMACPGKGMAAEQRFFDILKSVKAARIEGGKLLLLDADGKRILALTRAKSP